MIYHLFLGLHIIGVVSWFAGLFYLVRLLVNHSEVVTNDQAGKEYIVPQLVLMTKRLHRIIALPAAVFTLLTGGFLMGLTKAYIFPWFHLKLVLVWMLVIYHYFSYSFMKKFETWGYEKSPMPISGIFLRYYNELATVLLVAIVFLVVMKDIKMAFLAWSGFMLFLMIFMLIFQWRRKLQKQ